MKRERSGKQRACEPSGIKIAASCPRPAKDHRYQHCAHPKRHNQRSPRMSAEQQVCGRRGNRRCRLRAHKADGEVWKRRLQQTPAGVIGVIPSHECLLKNSMCVHAKSKRQHTHHKPHALQAWAAGNGHHPLRKSPTCFAWSWRLYCHRAVSSSQAAEPNSYRLGTIILRKYSVTSCAGPRWKPASREAQSPVGAQHVSQAPPSCHRPLPLAHCAGHKLQPAATPAMRSASSIARSIHWSLSMY